MIIRLDSWYIKYGYKLMRKKIFPPAAAGKRQFPGRCAKRSCCFPLSLSRNSILKLVQSISRVNCHPSQRRKYHIRIFAPKAKVALSVQGMVKKSIISLASEKRKPQITCLSTSASPQPPITCDLRPFLFY